MLSEVFPVIPTIDVVIFPNAIVPLLVLDDKIINGINRAISTSSMILLLAAKNLNNEQHGIDTEDLYSIGTVASIMRVIQIPEGGLKVLVQGSFRARVTELSTPNNMLEARVERYDFEPDTTEQDLSGIIRQIRDTAERVASSGSYLFSPDFHIILSKMHDTEKVADFVLSNLNLNIDDAQALLESTTQRELLTRLLYHLNREIESVEIQEKIKNSARESMNQSQKEFYLREQLRAIKHELGEDDMEEIELMRAKMESLPLTEDVKKEVMRQINRLERTAPDSLEATVTRNYLEWIFSMPWGVETIDNLDINHVKSVLDEDHYGLKEIKDRILDFISIRTLKNNGYAPILCFVGPPGTGKTSLGKSIARSLGRTYARISLGGVKDEAEIRGHRRTYVGAMPGRFIQAIRKAESSNPLIVIDELDKIGSDFRGDPSAAMLEILDPQQNKTFYDNYLGIPFDLSKVMFIATANSIDTISEPLKDRLEIIELSGYTMEEKIHIAQKHLVQRGIADTGLEGHISTIDADVIRGLVLNYTRESGVRQLERLIHKLCSKIARTFVEKNNIIHPTIQDLSQYLGPEKFIEDESDLLDRVGISNGLAWTIHGGVILKIEAVLAPGKGALVLTGQLGDVMKESAQAALTYVRSHAQEFNIDDSLFSTQDLHIHVPAGAIPKDGPSAGISMLTAILSAYTKRRINARYAMTGELNLRGEVMPIGGVKEKILAALRNNFTHVIIPHKNKHELSKLEDLASEIDIVLVNHANEVLEHVLMPNDTDIHNI